MQIKQFGGGRKPQNFGTKTIHQAHALFDFSILLTFLPNFHWRYVVRLINDCLPLCNNHKWTRPNCNLCLIGTIDKIVQLYCYYPSWEQLLRFSSRNESFSRIAHTCISPLSDSIPMRVYTCGGNSRPPPGSIVYQHIHISSIQFGRSCGQFRMFIGNGRYT